MSLDFALVVDIDSGSARTRTVEVFSLNITHNLREMWIKAGVYDALYESDGKCAGEIIEALVCGLGHMEEHPAEYQALNPPNGWGSYDGAFRWLTMVTRACTEHHKAIIAISK